MPRTSSWTELNRSIHRGCDPYAGFDAGRRTADHQGWHSDHPFLRETLAALRPSVVVEVGVWKGASSITMAETMRDRAIDGAVLAVDTWLGSWEHYEHETFFADLHIQNGYPTLYNTFITNVLDKGVSDFILPLALDSANAAFVVKASRDRPRRGPHRRGPRPQGRSERPRLVVGGPQAGRRADLR